MTKYYKKYGKKYPIIDTHMHIGVNPLTTFTENDLIPAMDRSGIDIQILFQVNEGFTHETPSWNPFIGNDYIAKVQSMFPNRVIGLGMINPWWQAPKKYLFPLEKRGKVFDLVTESPALDEVERCIVKLGLWGLKMHPLLHGYHINTPEIIDPILEKLTELQRKVGRKLIIVTHCMGDSIFNSPDALADVAERFPELLFLAVHSGFVWGGFSLLNTIGKLENVKLDLTTCSQRQVVYSVYERYGAEKFTVGSDMPFATYEIARAIVYDIFKKDEERELVLGGNIAKYLGLNY
ncbi:hypothetical protein HRbin06_00970 [archaeon HR06]|nr:hypothetical protein HRbin06_00970 [archaeon HR06]